MRISRLLATAVSLLVVSFSLAANAQETAVRGKMTVTVQDAQGAVIPNATVSVAGPNGTVTRTSNASGQALFETLAPGYYSVKASAPNFAAAQNPGAEVFTDRTSFVTLKLQPGAVSQTVEVTAPAVTVDTTSTATGSNLTDTFYSKVPVQRNVTGLFYVAPGAVSGGASGQANPSISGGSGLENNYVADGVNITDNAFGGLGVFSRVYGSEGTGINLSFIKEVHVKTAGFQPQYGRATGGVVQIVTKSGSNEYHGAISTYISPKGFELQRLNPDNFGLVNPEGSLIHLASYDIAGELGGYVPGLRNRLFFFGSFNPSFAMRFVRAPSSAGLSSSGDFDLRTDTYNYAFKGTGKLTENQTLEFSIFGDPAHTNTGPWRRMVMDNTTAFSKLDFGTRNMVARYNATLSPTWLFNASATWSHNRFNEGGFPTLNEIIDQTQTEGLPGQRGQFIAAGLGFVENTTSDNYGVELDTQKVFHFAGEHTFSLGYNMGRPIYDGARTYSGPVFNIPSANADGNSNALAASADAFGLPANASWRLLLAPSTCTLCPLMNVPGYGMVPVLLRIYRSEWDVNAAGQKLFNTSGRYHAAYINDSWSPNRHITFNAGLRWEQQRLTGEAVSYAFTDNWSPRLGVAVDPLGDRKTKIWFNFGRYDYAIPLDMAERSLTNELDYFGLRIAPDFTISNGQRVVALNQYGTVTPIVDAAHVLNGAAGGVSNSVAVSSESTTAIHPGTKMMYEDEYVGGIEHEFPGGIIASVKYIRRNMQRIIEDASGIPPEAYLAGVNQVYNIANLNAATDIFTNPVEFTFPADAAGNFGALPPQCDPTTVIAPVQDSLGNLVAPGGACFATNGVNGQPAGSAVPDGVPDGFPNPIRKYWAWEFEVNKSFSHNWLARINYRYAKLFGNYEGALRNDNGQTDPGISSLYDFTTGDFNLLGDQFRPGPLPTDRRHVGNVYLSYTFSNQFAKGLTVGTGLRLESGIPISELAAHPAYENAGEVPIGGRGKLGRTPFTGTWDMHADYAIPVTERTRFVVAADLFNILNQRKLQYINQDIDLGFGTPNADFLKPTNITTTSSLLGTGFQSPFSARLAVKFIF